jgi:hypothetical protein
MMKGWAAAGRLLEPEWPKPSAKRKPMKKKYKGLHEYRFKDNPEEKRFAKAWEKQNVPLGTGGSSTLAYLLNTGENQHHPPEPSERDYVVSATVIQWLGSPVGQQWLEELGYKRKNEDAAALRRAFTAGIEMCEGTIRRIKRA